VLSVLDHLFEARGAGCSLAKIWLPAASIKLPCDDGNDKSLSSFGRYLHCSCGLLVRDTWSHGSAKVIVVSRVITEREKLLIAYWLKQRAFFLNYLSNEGKTSDL